MVKVQKAIVLAALSVPTVLADLGLFARQLPGLSPTDVPDACVDKCKALSDAVTNDPGCLGDIDCLCGSDISSGIGNCLQCGYSVSPNSYNGTSPDALIQQYTDACEAAGHPVSSSPSSSSAGSSTASKTSATATSSTATVSGAAATGSSTSGGGASIAWNTLTVVAAVAVGAMAML